jgi:glycosyltransferase involved in cell wall biosynthesis
MKARRALLRTRTLPARPTSGAVCSAALIAPYEPGPVVDAPLASIVIPAHNEEAVLARCLRALLAGSLPGELDVIVVANACTDRTAEIAREAVVQVVETSTPGKANALRLGDAKCVTFPRIYVDADIELESSSVRALVAALNGSDALAAAPVPTWDMAGASGPVRRVQEVHELLIAPRRALAGVGVYALTEGGHGRIFPMPNVVSDDSLVHRRFTASERLIVADAKVIVRPPRTLRAYLHRRIRIRQGCRELDALGIHEPEGRLRLQSLGRLVADRSVNVLDAAFYLGVLVVDRVITRRGNSSILWPTDATSRRIST